MSLRKRRNLLLLAVFHFIMLAAFLPGCKEGTKTTPASALLTEITSETKVIDLSTAEDAVYNLIGKVVNKENNEAISNVSVELMFKGSKVDATRTSSDGSFYFSKLPPEIYDLTFTHAEYKLNKSIIRILDDGSMSPANPEIKMELNDNAEPVIKARFEGMALHSVTGASIQNLNVKLVNAQTETVLTSTLTGANGLFSFQDLGTGSYKITVGEKSLYDPVTETFEITQKGLVLPKFILFSMEARPLEKYSIQGLVKSQNREALANYKVTIIKSGSANGPDTYTTGEGKFFFDLSEAGDYIIKASKGAIVSDDYRIRVQTDGTVSPAAIELIVMLNSTVETGDIKGKVYDAFTGGPIEYASVKISEKNVGVTDSKGMFIAKNFAPGIYRAEISKFGYETMISSFEFKVQNSQATTIPATLTFPLLHNKKTGYGSIAGRLLDVISGLGIPNKFVRIFKWEPVTKEYQIDEMVSGTLTTVTRQSTQYEVTSSLILTSKTSAADANTPPELVGAFKLTHLEPGSYIIHISDSLTVAAYPNPRGPMSNSGPVRWQDLPENLDDTVIKRLTVVDGQTTYWTNYEQPFVNP